ncbi:hypothetical protein [Micromonospora rosaria]|uniref:hypothetical protein n=1 Tax=Micromonospora rosaria TaxID=47874 RepID=UPI0012FBD83B|nr:hypothetical protein [Micromonospora rosaria]
MPERTRRSDPNLGPSVGERVHVRWGLDLLPGLLIERYDSSSGGRAVVRLDPQGPGDAEPQTVTVPISEVHPAEDVEELDPPGTWISHSEYEHEVVRALSRVLRRIKWADVTKLEHSPDARYDYLADTSRGPLVVEVKYSHREDFTEARAGEVARQLAAHPAALKFLVSNARFPDRSLRRLAPGRVMPVTWRSPKDDIRLDKIIRAALKEFGSLDERDAVTRRDLPLSD